MNSAGLHPTARQLCATAGISRRRFFNALKIRRNGCDELHAAVMAGSLTMNLGLKVAKFDHVGQRLILAEFPTVKPRDRAGFVEIVRLTLEQEKANG